MYCIALRVGQDDCSGHVPRHMLRHVLGRHVSEHLLKHVPDRHVPKYVLKDVPEHVLRQRTTDWRTLFR